MRISDWSSDVCSSDLIVPPDRIYPIVERRPASRDRGRRGDRPGARCAEPRRHDRVRARFHAVFDARQPRRGRSEEHTSELQSLMRISYAVFCLKKKKTTTTPDKVDCKTTHITPSLAWKT